MNIVTSNAPNIISQRYNRKLESEKLTSSQNSVKSFKHVNIQEMENKLNAYLHVRESKIPSYSVRDSPKRNINNDQFLVYAYPKKRENSNYKGRYQKISHFGDVMHEAFREVPQDVPYIRERMICERNRWNDFPSFNEIKLFNNKKSSSRRIEKSNYYYPAFKPVPASHKNLYVTNSDLLHYCKCMEQNFLHNEPKELKKAKYIYSEIPFEKLKINSKYLNRAKIPNFEWARKYEEYFPVNRKQKIISQYDFHPEEKGIYAKEKSFFKKRKDKDHFNARNNIQPKGILMNPSGVKSWHIGKSSYPNNNYRFNGFQDSIINSVSAQKHVRWNI